MADNYNIKDAANSTIAIAADELSAGVFSPRVTPLHNGTDVTESNPLPVNVGGANITIAANSTLTLVGTGEVVSANFTRPNDTTAYAIGDVVSNSTSTPGLLEFPNLTRVNGGSAYITLARIATDQKSNPSAYRIHLYNDNNITLTGDNVPRVELYADNSKKNTSFVLGPMTTPANTTNSTISAAEDNNLRVFVKSGASTRSIWAQVETLTANTPAANQNFTITFGVDQN